MQAQCTHYGLTQTFRGLKPQILNLCYGYLGLNIFHNIQLSTKFEIDHGIKMGIMLMLHCVFYPLENIKIRMWTDVQKTRLYANMMDCYTKMKNY